MTISLGHHLASFIQTPIGANSVHVWVVVTGPSGKTGDRSFRQFHASKHRNVGLSKKCEKQLLGEMKARISIGHFSNHSSATASGRKSCGRKVGRCFHQDLTHNLRHRCEVRQTQRRRQLWAGGGIRPGPERFLMWRPHVLTKSCPKHSFLHESSWLSLNAAPRNSVAMFRN